MRKVSNVVHQNMDELMEEKLKKYEKVASLFQNFFHAEDLLSQIDSKVEKDALKQIENLKADKTELS